MSTAELARARPRLRRPASQWVADGLPWAGFAIFGITAAVGLGVSAAGGRLGLELAPFVFYWGPRATAPAAISVLTIAGALAIAPAIVARVRAGLAYAACMYVLALALGVSLNLAHEGLRGLWAVFATGRGGSVEGPYEYLPSLPALVHGIPYFLAHFAALFPYLSLHAQGNPPGPLIALDLLDVRSATGMAALCIGVGALTAPLAYDLGRSLGGEQRGRIAGMLTSFSPTMLLFGVTSADYAFASLGMIAACVLVRAGGSHDSAARSGGWTSWWWLPAGAVAAALASFFSWLLLAIPAWAALVVVKRNGWRAGVRVGMAAALGIAVLNGSLWLAFGYDPVSALHATSNAYLHGTFRYRPYWFYLFGSPTAWALMLGLPITWLALRALGAGDGAAVATWTVVLAASLLGTTGGETERIWLPFAPLACVAAAAAVPTGRLRPVLLLLCMQALAVELLFFTVW
ncbi:MAG: hypothetical protein ACLP01_28405 [Solirubrobacteraceae bacterium]